MFEQGGHAVPVHRAQPDDQLSLGKGLLLGGHVDVEIGVQLVQLAHGHVGAAIQRLANGETLLQPVSLGPVRAQFASTSNGSGTHLTEREASILRLVAGGYSNKEIARALQLSEGTIKNYITDILLKLDCRDRTHAVVKAIAQRLL